MKQGLLLAVCGMLMGFFAGTLIFIVQSKQEGLTYMESARQEFTERFVSISPFAQVVSEANRSRFIPVGMEYTSKIQDSKIDK